MRTPPLPADFIHARICKPKCAKLLTLPSLWGLCQQVQLLTLPLPRHQRSAKRTDNLILQEPRPMPWLFCYAARFDGYFETRTTLAQLLPDCGIPPVLMGELQSSFCRTIRTPSGKRWGLRTPGLSPGSGFHPPILWEHPGQTGR